MKKILPILIGFTLLGFSSCKKDEVAPEKTSYQVSFETHCDTNGYVFEFLQPDGFWHSWPWSRDNLTVGPLTYHKGDSIKASVRSNDSISQVTITLYIDGVKTNPNTAVDSVSYYMIESTLGH